MSVRAFNAVEIVVDITSYGGQPCLAITLKRPGTTQGSIRAWLDLDTASVLAAQIANQIDAARRG